ncbi:uncharacterized protein LOC127863423 isoform X2 [Dreissena polymorpha]|uniref:uncharacterized protein LOC127863423 isoform X2 n=1 Tax=Dreissena polymorpha TaxID=45954 RepID=UPI002264906E|nr:uncharacterized protein LOC127863423 isoform X2 [Dreissena polymorpha]
MTSSESSVTMVTPTSDFIDNTGSTTAAANTVTMEISVTSTASGLSVAVDTNTDLVASVTHDQSSTAGQPSTQFPMQHSTEQLPGNPVPVSTTDSMTFTSTEGQNIQKSDSSASVLSSKSVSVTPAASDKVNDVMTSSTTSVNDIASSTATSVNDIDLSTTSVNDMNPLMTTSVNDIIPSTSLSVNDTISSTSQSVSSDSSLSSTQATIISDTSSTSLVLPTSVESQPSSSLSSSRSEHNSLFSTESSEPIDPNSATQPLSGTATTQFVITTSATIENNLPSPSLDLYLTPSKAVSTPATSGSSYTTYVPPQTDYTGLPSTGSTVFSTSAAPLPSQSPIPAESAPKSQSTLLGGGLPNYVVYIGAPGLGVLLILLIVCIICMRRRKKKNKASLIKSASNDLWVNPTNDRDLQALSNPVRPESLENGIPTSPSNAKLDSGEMLLRLRKGQTGLSQKCKSMPLNDTDFSQQVTSLRVAKKRTFDENKCPISEKNDREKSDKNGGKEKREVCCMSSDLRFREIRRQWEERKVSNKSEPYVELPARPNAKGCTTYEAVFDFTGSHGNHLDLIQGDQIHVTRKEDNWWQGSVGERSGWFPSNYVQATSNAHVKTEDEVESGKERVTSFLLKRDDTPSTPQRYSHLTEEQIEAEPIYCKIQHKDKRSNSSGASTRSNSVTPTHPYGYNNPIYARSDTALNTVPSIVYTTKYAFEARNVGELTIAKGDVVHCKEEGKHGWIRGTNIGSKKEGWCPASYLEKLLEKEKVIVTPDPASYIHLEANKGDNSDLVGIVHQAIHSYTAEKDGDLTFERGDHINVFQVLENGWWLGSIDKSVGWFPGAYVQMLDHPSSSPSPSTVCSESPEDEKPDSADSGGSDVTSDVLTPPVSTTTTPTKLKPARKAPPPPLKLPLSISGYNTEKHDELARNNIIHNKPLPDEINEKKLNDDVNTDHGKVSTSEQDNSIISSNKSFKIPRPTFAPPPPPSKNQTHQHSGVSNDDPLYESVGQAINNTAADNNSRSIKDRTGSTVQEVVDKPKRTKPPVPIRYIKPTFVTVPHAEIKITDINNILANDEVVRRRAPPKISTPKLGPIRQKLSVPTNLEDQIPSTEDTTSFQLTPQRKSDLVRNESQDLPTPDSPPYRTMSSFGSTFGKPNEKLLPKPSPKPVVRKSDIDIKPFSEELNMAIGKSNIAIEQANAESVPSIENKLQASKESLDDLQDHSPGVKVSVDSGIPKHPQQLKSGIPLTPKMKVSKLQAPKQVSIPINTDSGNIGDNSNLVTEKTEELQIENVSKLPKLKTDNSKFPVSQHNPDEVNGNERPQQNMELESLNEATQKATPIQIEEQVSEPSVNSLSEPDKRTRADSIGRPPVAPKPKSNLPKCLPKPKIFVKEKELNNLENAIIDVRNENVEVEPKNDNTCNEEEQVLTVDRENQEQSEPRSESETEEGFKSGKENDSKVPTKLSRDSSEHESKIPGKRSSSESESKLPVKPKVITETESKIPLGSAIAQKSPQLRGRKSNIPSPGMRNKSKDKSKTELEQEKSQGTNNDGKSLRQRSNSPANRTGIPSSVRYRSNSPAGKSGIPSPGNKSPKHKPSGLVAPKKIPNGEDFDKITENSEQNHVSEEPVASANGVSNDSTNAKPESPSKPPRLQKQGSQDGRPPKGKSLLPLIHKSMESGKGSPNGVSPPTTGTKQKRGIPVAKPKKPSSTSSDDFQSVAIKGYTAQSDGELTFTKGALVTELSDCDRAGWYVGMLPDGTTGLYPADHFRSGHEATESEA